MKLLVGLGNPGPKYANNRHNIGFMAMDRFADDLRATDWRSKFQGLVAEARIGSEKLILLKPETFMNLSGQSVGEAMRFYKLTPEDVIVFHDEIDLDPAKLRVKRGGGHAGHNGLRSLHQHIGPDYHRVRLGVGHPGHKDAVPHYVLKDFPKADQDWLELLLQGMSEGLPDLIGGDSGRFMNAVARRSQPAKQAKADTKKPKPQAQEAPEPESAENRSPLQRLMDKFK